MPTTNNGIIVFATLAIAFLLTLLPMPAWAIWLRPAWILMVLVYWAMVTPEQVNVGIAWIVGIFLDVAQGTLLGEHALALTAVVYFVARMHSRLRMSPLMQQGISVFILVIFYQFILYCIQGSQGDVPHSWLYWVSSLTSMLLWPWVANVLYLSQSRFRAA